MSVQVILPKALSVGPQGIESNGICQLVKNGTKTNRVAPGED